MFSYNNVMNMGIIIISIIITIANSWHIIYQWVQNKPGFVFTGIAHYYADYFLYTSQMAQGARGAWLFANHLFTNETLPPTWIYWLNVTLGHVGHLFGLSVFSTYNVSLVLLVLLVLFVWFTIIRSLFPKNYLLQTIAFLFLTTASNFLYKKSLYSDFWFSPTPALNRLGGVPHQVFQTILILSVIFLFSRIRPIGPIGLISLILISFLAANANPAQMLLVLMALSAETAYSYWKTKDTKVIIPLVVAAFAALPAAVLTNHEWDTQQVFIAAKNWEFAQHARVSLVQLFFALGPILVFIPFGIKSFGTQRPLNRILLMYALVSIAISLSPLPALLHTSPVRWLSPASYGVLPILAAVGVYKLCASKQLILALFVGFYLFFTIPSLLFQISSRSAPDALNHVQSSIYDALSSLPLQSQTVVLTNPALPYDVLVPTLSGMKSFTGHPIHTLFPDVKESLRQHYFSGAMAKTEGKQFFTDHNISVVLNAPFSIYVVQK
jgi:hypothetical protein